ncbi:hypothetical protein OM076_04920 [Solirubrobacter ginsenosidimutans]|uniref:Uncharacterized protein n=1 Tax=Solirubrobacter ginsenosidimutans TaxID=490573 RepID=A0A9X3MPW4_9ACTN|nr:hypothetical protein [Solirubrobacter ginsenosidimutans]MDA0159596.1 hypothetical protein [Solirubrobacter ginsenosidimutans]
MIPLGALVAWALVGAGFLNYDTAYSLLWGGDVAHLRQPDFSVPVAPTPHPLATALGVVLTPFGDAGQTLWVVIAFLSLGALAWVTYELGAHWFGPAAGAVAGIVILTRIPVLSFGVRAYVDIPYVALALGAVLAEARGRGPRTVLVLLGLAGLLRPEAWLFAFAYAAYKRDLKLLPWAAAAPVIWMAHDLVLAGDPLHSLLGTRDNAEVLQRTTGLLAVPSTVPRRLGEILREPGLLGAAAGGILVLALMRRKAALPIAAGFVSIAAFCVLAAAGLPILGRYLLLPAAILAIFCGAGMFGWLQLDREDPWRNRWMAIGAVVLLAFVVFAPGQVNRIDDLRGSMGTQQEILSDLHAITDEIPCRPVAVPNHRPVPHVALWTGIPPGEIVSAQLEQPTKGVYLDPANERVRRNFTLDPHDPKTLTASVPPGFQRAAENPSWVVYSHC